MAYWRHLQGKIKEPACAREGDHFAIIGPYGNVWHHDTFPTAEEAERYLRSFWAGDHDFDIGEWRMAAASVTIEAMEPSWRIDRDTDGSPKGPDPQGLDGEAATAGAAEGGIAQPLPSRFS